MPPYWPASPGTRDAGLRTAWFIDPAGSWGRGVQGDARSARGRRRSATQQHAPVLPGQAQDRGAGRLHGLDAGETVHVGRAELDTRLARGGGRPSAGAAGEELPLLVGRHQAAKLRVEELRVEDEDGQQVDVQGQRVGAGPEPVTPQRPGLPGAVQRGEERPALVVDRRLVTAVVLTGAEQFLGHFPGDGPPQAEVIGQVSLASPEGWNIPAGTT